MEYNKEEIIKEFKDWSKFRVQGVWKDSIEKLLIEFIEQRLVKKLTIPVVGSSLPKVCKGCGTLSTKVIDKKYLTCCPDNNYIPMEDYCKNSIYPDKQF